MKSKAHHVFLFFLFTFNSCSKHDSFTELKGPYLGQKPPESGVALFLPGLISIDVDENIIACLEGGRVCIFSNERDGILYSYEKNGFWTAPQQAPLDHEGLEYDFNAGPDERKLYFTSKRPTSSDDLKEEFNIWILEWTGSGWGEPYPLSSPPNTAEYNEFRPTITSDGTVYFFANDRPEYQASGIYRSQCANNVYSEIERLPWPINTDYDEYDPVIAADESYLLFSSRRPGGFGRDDMYICFRQGNGDWTDPVNLGELYNSSSWEHRLNATPNGKYVFFASGRNHPDLKDEVPGDQWITVSGIYWMDMSFVDDLKITMLERKCAADIIEKHYQNYGVEAAVEALANLYNNEKEQHYFLPYKLLSICENMIEDNNFNDSDQFYQALVDILQYDNRIEMGYAITCIDNGRIDKGFDLLKKTMAESPREFMAELNLRGRNFLWDSRFEDALEVYLLCVQEFPDWYYAYYQLARTYERLERFQRAKESCEKALELNPDYLPAAQLLEELKEKN
jgi:tetratricopeptide (TPR) repeat protein